MTKRKRRNHTSGFKAKVAVAAFKGERTLAEQFDLHAYETPAALREGLSRYFAFYNARRRHSALDRRTPDTVYFE